VWRGVRGGWGRSVTLKRYLINIKTHPSVPTPIPLTSNTLFKIKDVTSLCVVICETISILLAAAEVGSTTDGGNYWRRRGPHRRGRSNYHTVWRQSIALERRQTVVWNHPSRRGRDRTRRRSMVLGEGGGRGREGWSDPIMCTCRIVNYVDLLALSTECRLACLFSGRENWIITGLGHFLPCRLN